MNFYEYYQPGEALEDSPVYLAALDIIKHGLQVIPLVKGSKEPANIKNVYDLLSKPIHEQNINFYFKDRAVDIGIILTDDMEFLDIDEKNKKGITKSFLTAIKQGWPELYDKLVHDETPSGGCHLIYRSEIVGGKQSLAKIHAHPNPLTLIERISKANKQYIKISPSEGYTLKKGNPLELPLLTAEERNFLSALAASFNEVHIPEVKKSEAEREDSPWYVFNEKNDWKYIRNELIDRNWSVVMDLPDKVIVKRPGNSEQRSSGAIFKDHNLLYLYTTSSEFEDSKAYSPFGVYCFLHHDNNIGLASRQLASEGIGVNITEEGQFWKKSKTTIEIKYTELLNWLHGIGYRKFNGSIVQIINNIIELTDEAAMKRAFINEVEYEVQDKMYSRVGKIFGSDGGLMAMLNELEDKFITDTKDKIWLFFHNIVIEITPTGFIPHEYKSINGYIWKSAIIDRDFYSNDFEGCDADKFLEILSGDKKADIQEIVGYTISKYKDPLNPRAVIIIEDISSEDEGESQGGSGKGLLFQFIKQFRKTADFDGKNFHPSDPFLFQNVDPDTAILFVDDVEKSFKFSSLYSLLTGSMMINKKNKPQIIMPFEKAPKIFITSNYSVGSMDISAQRRKYEFAINKYFGKDVEPIDIFGKMFFSEWDKKEWLMFDNLIVDCCYKYLSDGKKKRIGNITVNSAERSLIANTNKEFIDYMDSQLQSNFFDFAPITLKTKTIKFEDGSIITNAVDVDKFIQNRKQVEYYLIQTKEQIFEKVNKSVKYKNLTITRVTHWIKRWAEARGVEIDSSYIRSSDRERCYRIIDWKIVSTLSETDTKTEPGTQSEMWKPNDHDGF